VQQRLPECPEPLSDLIGQARTWRRWALHTLPQQRHWTRGLVALLGDAAHPILPFLGQGGAMALEDAVVLADAMYASGGEVLGAFKSYETRRRSRAARVADASQKNGRAYHQTGMLATMRNLVLRGVPPQRLIARYDWLYGWRG
jgi:salicylate hydroxylase